MSSERRRRRPQHAAPEKPSGPAQPPWRLHERWFEPTPTVSEDEWEFIHQALADDVRAELDEFTNRRIAEGGVATDF